MRDPAAMRDRYRRIAYRYRHLPGDHGLRVHTIDIGLGSWSAGDTGLGTVSTTWTPIVERDGLPPKARWLSTEEVAVGALQKGSVQIGPITPDFSGGGTSVSTIMLATITKGQTRSVRITGPMHPTGALYEIQNSDFGRALHYTLTCEPIGIFVAPNSPVLTDPAGNILTWQGNQLNPQ